MEPSFFNKIVVGNSIETYCWFVAILFIGFLCQYFLSKTLTRIVFRLLKKYSSGVGYEQLLNLLERPLRLFLLIFTCYCAFNLLQFPEYWKLAPKNELGLKLFISTLFKVATIFSITWIILRMVDFFGLVLAHKAYITESKADDQLVIFVRESIKVVVAIFSLFFTLGSVFNINIASLIAGLGIGGLAVALAAKETLENLLGSFTIFLDKPFTIGDLVQIGNITGNVEKIGFRSTRIRTLEKSFVTVPNKKMVEAELDNLTLRTQRRIAFSLHLNSSANSEQIKKTIDEIGVAIKSIEQIQKNDVSVKLFDFSQNTINILVEYYVLTSSAEVYLNIRQNINLKIIDIIQLNNCSLALPIQK